MVDRDEPLLRSLEGSAATLRSYGSVFHSMAAVIEYGAGRTTIAAGVNGWRGVGTLSMRMHGTPGQAWVWLDPTYEVSAWALEAMPGRFENCRNTNH